MDETDMAQFGQDLLQAAVADTPHWVSSRVYEVAQAQRLPDADDTQAWLADAIERAQCFVGTRLGELVSTDIDRQATTPLSVFRDAVRFPVEVLHQLGAEPIHRGDVSRWAFPNDPFGITPGNLSDVGEATHAAGIVWGAAKAGLHLQRRRSEGQL
jgi:hypothetical protein